MKTQKMLWGCEQIPVVMYSLCLDPGFWLSCLHQIHIGILTCRVMFCLSNAKEAGDSTKHNYNSSPLTWLQISGMLEPELFLQLLPWTPGLDTGWALKCGEEQWKTLWKDLSPGASHNLDLKCSGWPLLPSHWQELQFSWCLAENLGPHLCKEAARLSLPILLTVWSVPWVCHSISTSTFTTPLSQAPTPRRIWGNTSSYWVMIQSKWPRVVKQW